MNRRFLRGTAWALIAFIALGPVAPILRAQDPNLPAGTPMTEAYVTQVQDRLASREGLEKMYQGQVQRQVQMQSELQGLQTMQVPQGLDPQAWQARMQADQTQLQAQIAQNQNLMTRTKGKLTPIYQKLTDDAARIKASGNPELQQQIGNLIGVTGNYVVPIWGRPPPAGSPPGTPNGLGRITAAEYGAMVKYGAQQAHLRTVDWRIPKYQNIAANAGSRANNAATALGELPSVEWVPEANPETGNMRLIAKDAALGTPIAGKPPVETPVPAKITNANGQVVDNPEATTGANDWAVGQNLKSQLTNEIVATKLKASRAVNSAQQEFFDKHAADLETKKAQLEADLKAYNDTHTPISQRLGGLAKDAGKWALMSAGVAAGANVVNQLSHNGWDPSKVNYGQAVAFLGDKHFWGGTAGSFVGSMAGSALASAIPGGPFAKVALSIAGASLGWQVGSGNLKNTDWIGLGVTTLGSTAGYMIGMALGGPIGAFLGGIVGQYASQFIYDKLKELLIKEEAATSGGAAGIPVVDAPPVTNPGQLPGYQGTNPAQTGYPGGGVGPGGGIPNPGYQPQNPNVIGDGSVPGSPGSMEDADKRMKEAYDAAQAALAAGDKQLSVLKM